MQGSRSPSIYMGGQPSPPPHPQVLHPQAMQQLQPGLQYDNDGSNGGRGRRGRRQRRS